VRKLSHVDRRTDGCYKITFPESYSLDDIKLELKQCPDLSYVSYDYYYPLSGEPDDTDWDE